ncbi:FoF1 ATP synthase subunit gamma [Balneola sp. MJW-20]|uniref:F0F1 ATP synthase subunit gamma n=1 Tax=Gracilimonas aurantiaca TaxID=3234185 RepID=UPI003466A03C
MNDQEFYKKKIHSAEELHSIVRSMKVLSSVSIRQFENAVISLDNYFKTIEHAFQVMLINSCTHLSGDEFMDTNTQTGVLIFGSGHGLCGAFDEQINHYIEQKITSNQLMDCRFIVTGRRLGAMFERGYKTDNILEMPGSVEGIGDVVYRLIADIEQWRSVYKLNRILLVNHHPTGKGTYSPRLQQLFPLNEPWLMHIRDRDWPTNNLPQMMTDPLRFFPNIIRQYIWISLFRSISESLASEHISRLSSMTLAEKKIAEKVHELKSKYSHARHAAITDELLDILSGYIAVTENEPAG